MAGFRDEIKSLLPNAAGFQDDIDAVRAARMRAQASKPLSPEELKGIKIREIRDRLARTVLDILEEHDVPQLNIWGSKYINPSGRQYEGHHEPTITGIGYHIVRQRYTAVNDGSLGEVPVDYVHVDDSLGITTDGDLVRFSGGTKRTRHFYDRSKLGHSRAEKIDGIHVPININVRQAIMTMRSSVFKKAVAYLCETHSTLEVGQEEGQYGGLIVPDFQWRDEEQLNDDN